MHPRLVDHLSLVEISTNMTLTTLLHVFMNFLGDVTPPFSSHEQDADESTSVHEDNNTLVAAPGPEQPLLAHMTKKKPLPPGNVKQLLSPTANKPTTQPQEVNIHGIYTGKLTWHQVFMLYHHVMLLETRVYLLTVEPTAVLQEVTSTS